MFSNISASATTIFHPRFSISILSHIEYLCRKRRWFIKRIIRTNRILTFILSSDFKALLELVKLVPISYRLASKQTDPYIKNYPYKDNDYTYCNKYFFVRHCLLFN